MKLRSFLLIAFLALIAIFIWLQSRNQSATSPQASPKLDAEIPFVSPESEAEWYDVRFKCTVEQNDNERLLHLRNSYQGHPVGFDVSLRGSLQTAVGWDEHGKFKISSEKLKGLDIKFLRSGTESDRFFEVLDSLYKTDRKPSRMVDSFPFDAIPLEGEEKGLAKVKLFGNPNGSEEEYFEVYFNINFKEGWAELAEKDSDYRKPLIAALARR